MKQPLLSQTLRSPLFLLAALTMMLLAHMLFLPVGIAWADGPASDLQTAPDAAEFVFEGAIQARPTEAVGEWTIAGRTVIVTQRTQFLPNAASMAVGDVVRVVADRRKAGDGGAGSAPEIVALLIAKTPERERPLNGKIEALPADGLLGVWKIAGQDVTVTRDTRLQGDRPDVGDDAVAWVSQVEGVLTARQIMVKDARPQPPEGPVMFRGTVTAIVDATWTIQTDKGEVQVLTDEHTRIVGAPVVGDSVGVKGRSEGDVVLAQLIIKLGEAAEETEFSGFVTEILPTPQTSTPDVLPNRWAWKVVRPAHAELPAASWVVIVTEETRINVKPAEVAVGAWIKGAGLLSDPLENVVEAKVVRVTPAPRVRFAGEVMAVPPAETFPLGDWMIGDTVVHVTAQTMIEATPPALGANAAGFGELQADGSVKAAYLRTMRAD